jgi:hypothetical protein
MNRPVSRLAGRRPVRAVAAFVAVLFLVVAACDAAPAADSPTAAVRSALERVAAKDVDGLRSLACAGAEDEIRDRLGLPAGLGGELIPGVDTNAILDSVILDTSALAIEDEVVAGDTATVAVRGDLKVTFDPELLRPILERLAEAQGASLTPEQIDALLVTLARAGQDLPVTQTLELARESGAWKICSASD